MQERTKPVLFSAWHMDNSRTEDFNDWITFKGKFEYGVRGFDKSSGTYTVQEDGIYIFGLRANSGSELAWTQINFYINNVLKYTVVDDANLKGVENNLGTTWTQTLKKGDKIRLKVDQGTVYSYLAWWGVRIIAN